MAESFRLEFSETLKVAKSLGASGIQAYAKTETIFPTMSAKKIAEVRRMMNDNGLEFSALCADFGSRMFYEPDTSKDAIDEEKRVMEIALKEACTVPMEIMASCCEAIDIIADFAGKGSALAISDAGVGIEFCKAALKGASLNVYINTKAMKDREYAELLNAKCDAMLDYYPKKAERVYNEVLNRLK